MEEECVWMGLHCCSSGYGAAYSMSWFQTLSFVLNVRWRLAEEAYACDDRLIQYLILIFALRFNNKLQCIKNVHVIYYRQLLINFEYFY
eukprot:scaffold91867_cov18-Prasinocladus_malaysianus.AAC.2